jgi:hypothetical protein
MKNCTEDFLNRKLLEGCWYFVTNPEFLPNVQIMQYSILEKGNDAEHGLLANNDYSINDIYHRDGTTVWNIDIPAECQIESLNKANNRKIAKQLVELVEKYPNWRFEQLLQNIGITIKGKDGYIIDLFNEKSETTYLRMMDYIEKLNQS